VVAAFASGGNGSNFRASARNTVRNATFFSGGYDGFGADDDGGTASTTSGTCGAQNPAGCSFALENVLAMNNTGAGIRSTSQTSSSITSVNAVNNAQNFSGQPASCGAAPVPLLGEDDRGADRHGPWDESVYRMGARRSNMKGAGKAGADLGANVLYRYENGIATTMPLWRKQRWPIPRVWGDGGRSQRRANDSCANLQLRLNINQNGCRFPTRYVGW